MFIFIYKLSDSILSDILTSYIVRGFNLHLYRKCRFLLLSTYIKINEKQASKHTCSLPLSFKDKLAYLLLNGFFSY